MKKNKYIQIRLTEEELKKIEFLADDMGMNKSQYILYLINCNYKIVKGDK